MSQVSDILKLKGHQIFSVRPDDSILNVLKLMSDKNVGAVLVLEGEQIAGIFSERDYARHSAKGGVCGDGRPVKELMTSKLTTISSSTSTDECMSVMTSKHIRHLPVVDQGKLVGMISIGDVVKRIIEDHKFSITQLERYVTGEAS